MPFRRRTSIPYRRQVEIQKKEQEQLQKTEPAVQDKVATIFAFTEEELDGWRNCTCPKRGCPTHPGEDIEHLAQPPLKQPRRRRPQRG